MLSLQPRVAIGLFAACLALAPARAQPQTPETPRIDKSGYHLFNPTPREAWRDLAADRPDATESPITVDAGAFQLEMSFAEVGLDRDDGRTSTSWSVAPINLKVGVTNSLDLQFLFNPLEHVEGPGGDEATGVGNFGMRAKLNLWGNDGGATALGLLPYVVFPTGDDDVADDDLAYGLVVPFALDLGEGWGLGAQVEIGYARDEALNRDVGTLAHTLVLGVPLVGDLAAYFEYIGEYSYDVDVEYRPTLSMGTTYMLNADTQLDAGLLVGLDDGDTEDLRLFTGITARF